MHLPKWFSARLACIHLYQLEKMLVGMEAAFAKYNGKSARVDDMFYEAMIKYGYKIDSKFPNLEISYVEKESIPKLNKCTGLQLGVFEYPKPIKVVKPHVDFYGSYETSEFTSLPRRADRLKLYMNKIADALCEIDAHMGWGNTCIEDMRAYALDQIQYLDKPDDGFVDDPFDKDL